jgi:nucleoside-diphosphate-sugar epimerase
MNKLVLILGGTGFLGQSLTRALKKNFRVDAFGSDVDVVEREQLTRQLSRHHYDYVINATGQITKPIEACRQQNMVGVANLIEMQNQWRFFLVQISTLLIHQPDNDYARWKLAAEAAIAKSIPQEQYVIIRLSNLYGPGQKKGLISHLLSRLNENRREFNFSDNDGTLSRFFLHVDDAAEFTVELLLGRKAGVYDLVGPDHYSIKELIGFLEAVSGRTIKASYSQDKPRGNIDRGQVKPAQFSFRRNLRDYLRANLKK